MKHITLFDQKEIDRFWAKVDIRGEDDCWEWQAHRNKQGYGRFDFRYIVTKAAHRIAWMITNNKEIPEGLQIRHYVCRNPACCNPKHLRLGTSQDDADDRAKDGTVPKGSRMPNAKLNEKQVIGIMRLLNSGRLKQYEIAEMFKVNVGIISTIKRRKKWKHVPWPK